MKTEVIKKNQNKNPKDRVIRIKMVYNVIEEMKHVWKKIKELVEILSTKTRPVYNQQVIYPQVTFCFIRGTNLIMLLVM